MLCCSLWEAWWTHLMDMGIQEMKARSNSSLQAMMAEMSVIRDGITSNSADLTEYKRHSISVQQQMQSQLTDLREKLTSAFSEITSLVKQKAATDQDSNPTELLSEIHALGRQLSMKTAELEALKKSYSSTHQQLQQNLVQLQGQLQSTGAEMVAAKKQAQAVQESVQHKLDEVELLTQRLRDQVEAGGRDGNATALAVQDDIAKLHEALTGLSSDFFEHKRLTQQVQTKLSSQVAALEDGRLRSGTLQVQLPYEKDRRTREGGGAWRTYTSKQVLGAKGASQLVGMFKNPDPPGAKEKEVREAEEKEAHARHFAGLLWTVIGVPPPDFTVVADSIGPSHRACLSIYTQPQPHPLKEVRVLGPRRSTPEEARKDGCDLKRLAQVLPAGKQAVVPPGACRHERQNQEGKHVPFLFFNAESGRYYRNRSSDVAYVPAKSRRKDDLAVILPELARTGSLLKQPLPFADKPAALFLLVDGLRNSSASEWCAKRFHTHLLPRLSALHSDPDDGELVSVVKEALTHLDHALLDCASADPARYAGCSIAVALLMGTRLVVCTLGGCRATICTPSSEPVGPVAKKRTGAELPKWSCRPVEGTLPGHTRIDILQLLGGKDLDEV
eukprot:g21081.t1